MKIALAAVGVVMVGILGVFLTLPQQPEPITPSVHDAEVQQPSGISEVIKPPVRPITITFVGDIMLDRNVKTRMRLRGETYPFANVVGAPYDSPDLLIGNLEGAISERQPPANAIDFAFDDNTADLLKRYGFDAVSLANNHGLDQGRAGVVSTHTTLSRAGVGYFGDGVRDDTEAWTTEVNGKTLAFFGYNIVGNEFDSTAAKAKIEQAVTEHDYVVVFMHWGAEYVPRPAESIQALGREFIDWGATAVVGAHPHVTQGMELWKQRPIFWSLGNFIFDQEWSTETQQGLVLTLSIGPADYAVELFPVNIKESQPTLALGDDRAALLARFAERSDIPDDLKQAARSGVLTWSE